MTAGWTPAHATAFIEWDYYVDFAINLMLFIADLPVPEDPMLVHQVRERLHQYHIARGYVISMIEFVDKFGANPGSIEQLLSDTDEGLGEVSDLYRDYDFESSLAKANHMMAELEKVTELALNLKNQALLWVYIIEWLSVTATGSLTAVVVWSLMVRRRMYREVGATRLRVSETGD